MQTPVRIRTLVAIAAITALMVAPATVWAVDRFTDVSDNNVFHDDISWLADAGVTLGCNPPTNDQFCPRDNVTREQMSAFMRRLAENQVVDAGALEGLTSADLANTVYVSADEGFVDVPAGSVTEVLALDVPAGSYMINARGSMNLNSGPAGRLIECTLAADTTSQTLQNFYIEPNGQVDQLEATFMIAHTFDAAGTIVLSCDADVGWDGNIIDPTISALSVNETQVTLVPAAADVDPNG